MNTQYSLQDYQKFLDSSLGLASSNWRQIHEETDEDGMNVKVFECSVNSLAMQVLDSPVGLILGKEVTQHYLSIMADPIETKQSLDSSAAHNTEPPPVPTEEEEDEDFFGNNNQGQFNQQFGAQFEDEWDEDEEDGEDDDYEEQTPPPPPPYVAPIIVGTLKEEKKVDKVYDLMNKFFVGTTWKNVLTEPLSVKYESGIRRKIPGGLAKISSAFNSFSLLTKHEKTLLLQKMKMKDVDLLMSVAQRIYESMACLDAIKWSERGSHISANYSEENKSVGFKQSVKMVEQILDAHIQSTYPISPASAALIRKIKKLAESTVKNSIQSSDFANDFTYMANTTLSMEWANFDIDTYSPPRDPKNKDPDNTMNVPAPVIKKSYKL